VKILKLLKKLVFYGIIMAIPYLVGYCNGYSDKKNDNNEVMEFIDDKKGVVLDSLESATDSAYNTIKKIIDKNRGEKK
jgi:hypothetical protein